MPMKNTKKVDQSQIADDMVELGLIPEDYKDEFMITLDRELRRESRRMASDVAGVIAGAMRTGRYTQGLAA